MTGSSLKIRQNSHLSTDNQWLIFLPIFGNILWSGFLFGQWLYKWFYCMIFISYMHICSWSIIRIFTRNLCQSHIQDRTVNSLESSPSLHFFSCILVLNSYILKNGRSHMGETIPSNRSGDDPVQQPSIRTLQVGHYQAEHSKTHFSWSEQIWGKFFHSERW